MKFLLNLFIAGFLLLLIDGKLPDFWIGFFFVYMPVIGVFIGALMDRLLPEEYFTIDKVTGTRTVSPTAPLYVIWYFKVCWNIFFPMLAAFAIIYYLHRIF